MEAQATSLARAPSPQPAVAWVRGEAAPVTSLRINGGEALYRFPSDVDQLRLSHRAKGDVKGEVVVHATYVASDLDNLLGVVQVMANPLGAVNGRNQDVASLSVRIQMLESEKAQLQQQLNMEQQRTLRHLEIERDLQRIIDEKVAETAALKRKLDELHGKIESLESSEKKSAERISILEHKIDTLGLRQLASVFEDQIKYGLGGRWCDESYDVIHKAYHNYIRRTQELPCMTKDDADMYASILRAAFPKVAEQDLLSHSETCKEDVTWAKQAGFPVAHDENMTKEEIIDAISNVLAKDDDTAQYVANYVDLLDGLERLRNANPVFRKKPLLKLISRREWKERKATS